MTNEQIDLEMDEVVRRINSVPLGLRSKPYPKYLLWKIQKVLLLVGLGFVLALGSYHSGLCPFLW